MDSINTELFIHSTDEIPDSFIKFSNINPCVDRCTAIPDVKIYFKTTGQVVNICQPIQQDNGVDINSFAIFFPSYQFNAPLHSLLSDSSSADNFKLLPSFKNNYTRTNFLLIIDIYIRKQYLSELYDLEEIPFIIKQLVKFYKYKNYSYKIENAINTDDCDIITPSKYKIEPMLHQKNNVKWMKTIEYKVKNNQLTLHTFRKTDNVSQFYIDSIKDYILWDTNTYKFVKPDTLPQIQINFNGAILSDEIGLGKTLSFISLMVESDDESPTLVICPKRICKQWHEEINKFTDSLSVKLVGNITQYKKLNQENVNDYNVYIIPYNLFESKKYLEHSECILQSYKWRRVILDESHEYIGKNNKQNIRNTNKILFRIKSDYRWLCSGTPYSSTSQLYSLIHYLSDDYNSYEVLDTKDKNRASFFSSNLIRVNTKDSIKSYIDIPEPEISTQFLDQTPIERMIYESALNDPSKMIELCNHIQVSDHHINILGNEPMTLDDIKFKMTQFLKKQIAKCNRRIEKYKKQLEQDPDNQLSLEKLVEFNDLLTSSKFKLDIFTNIEKKIDENESCPICLEEFDELTKVITPCGHFICGGCVTKLFSQGSGRNVFKKCPMCRYEFIKEELTVFKPEEGFKVDDVNKWGTKMAHLISYVNNVLSTAGDRIIIFSQWDNMLKLVSNVLKSLSITHITINGSVYTINSKIRKFKLDDTIKVALLSSEKSSSGLNLTEANHIVLLDTLNTDKETAKIIESQAIGRSVRIGQDKTVKVQRFIMRNTIEHEFYNKIYN